MEIFSEAHAWSPVTGTKIKPKYINMIFAVKSKYVIWIIEYHGFLSTHPLL